MLFLLDATMRLIDGNVESAAHVAILMFHLTGTLHDEPTFIGRLIQRSPEDAAMRTVEYALRVGELNDEGYLYLMPQVHGFDGAFAARLRRV